MVNKTRTPLMEFYQKKKRETDSIIRSYVRSTPQLEC